MELVHLSYVVRPYASTFKITLTFYTVQAVEIYPMYMYMHVYTCTCTWTWTWTVRIYESPLDRGHIPEAAMNGLSVCKSLAIYDVAYTTAQLTEASKLYVQVYLYGVHNHTYIHVPHTYILT